MKLTEDMLETMVKKANEAGWHMKSVDEGKKKTLDGALCSYASGVRREDVFAFFDTSLFGSGKTGFLLTAEAVYSDCFSRGGANASRLPLEDIRSVEPVQRGKRNNTVRYWDGGSVAVELPSAHRNGLLALLNVAAQSEGQLRELVAAYLPQGQGAVDAAQPTPEEIFRAGMASPYSRYDHALFLMEQAARMGCAEAQYELATQYAWGRHVAKSEARAAYWFEKAAEQGHAEAQCRLARCYDDGMGVAGDRARAAYWYEKAAEQGLAEAQYCLRLSYSLGLGVAEDLAKAAYWCEKAARQGYKDAQCTLADYYKSGYGVAKDMTRAVYWYEQAAQQGDICAICTLASCYENGTGVEKDEQKALSLYEQAVKSGHKSAQKDVDRLNAPAAKIAYDIGCMLYNRENRNMESVVHYITEAAELGHAKAQYHLGSFYSDGEGVAMDKAKAVCWYEKAAERGHASAQFNLGICYSLGEGVTADEAKAVYWYEKAAQQGVAVAQYNLGIHYYNGDGVRKDKTKAAQWYEKAARQGIAAAQVGVGICLFNGEGVPESHMKAKEWFQKAADQGNEEAIRILRENF